MNISQKIIEKLQATEKEKNIKIIWAIESGSRGWGFASPDSDYDCRFIYVGKKDWYLSIDEGKDFIEYPVDKVFDIAGWDIRKVLRLVKKSNISPFEWLTSPIVYTADEKHVKELMEVCKSYYNPVHAGHHYLSLAKKSLFEVLENDRAKLKKYFYILRPLACCQYIINHGTPPPMEYAKVLGKIKIKEEVSKEIDFILKVKKDANEDYVIDKNKILLDYFGETIKHCEDKLKKMIHLNNRDSSTLDEYFRKVINEVWHD